MAERIVSPSRRRAAVFAALAASTLGPAATAGSPQYLARQKQPVLVESRGDAIVVDQFRWGHVVTEGSAKREPRFQRTTIRPEQIGEVYWWSERFPPKFLAAHGQLAFVMKDETGVVGVDGASDPGFIVSFEARFKQGQIYNPVKGLKRGAYGSIVLATTLRDRIQRSIHFYGHSMDTFRLRLSQDQKVALVRKALEFAARNRDGEGYHTTRNSCITAAVDILNEVLPEGKRLKKWIIPGVLHNPKISLPRSAPEYLIARGLADPVVAWPNPLRVLELPAGEGRVHRIDARDIPGSGIPQSLLAFEEALFQLGSRAESLAGLLSLQRTMPPSDPRFVKFQAEIGPVQDEVGAALEAAVELAVLDPARTVGFYLKRRPPSSPAITAFEKALAKRLRGMAQTGQLKPSAKLDEVLGALVGAPDAAE